MGDDKLKKEVISLFSQGHDHNAVKSKLLEKGYTIDQINQALKEAFTYKTQPKKGIDRNVMILIGTGIIAIILIFTTIMILQKPHINQPVYSDDPSSWLETNKSGTTIINVDLVTKTSGFIDSEGLQFRENNIETVFKLYGYYQGEQFNTYYYDNANNVKMKLINDMNPSDNIIEGFIIFKLENKTPNYYIFVDEDWKKNILSTNIWWGFEQENKKQFEFNQISEGIYMDKIVDSKNSFSDDYSIHYNKVFVGDMTQEKIDQNNKYITMMVLI